MLIDILFILCLILAVFKGYTNGLIVAVFSLAGILIGLAAAMKLSAVVAVKLQAATSIGASWLPFISFALVLIAVIMLVRMGAALVQKAVELVFLGWLNKIAGIVLYLLLYAIVLSILLFFLEKLHFFSPATIQASVTYPYLQPIGPKVLDGIGTVVPFFKDMFVQVSSFFDGVEKTIK